LAFLPEERADQLRQAIPQWRGIQFDSMAGAVTGIGLFVVTQKGGRLFYDGRCQ